MKNIKTFFFCISLLTTLAGQAQTQSADSAVHRIFTTLKAKDEKAYVALYPDKEQMLRLVGNMLAMLVTEIQKMDTSAQQKEMPGIETMMYEQIKKKATPEEMEKVNEGFAKEFRALMKSGETKGIDWSQIELVRYELDTAVMQQDKMLKKLFGSDSIRTAKAIIHFKQGGAAYKLQATEMVYLPAEGGWYGAGVKQVLAETQSFDADEAIGEIQSSEQEYNKAVVEPAPKPKAKTPVKKSKPRSKT